jgi:type I site-specific restriction-modification system R (restriction) subunit
MQQMILFSQQISVLIVPIQAVSTVEKIALPNLLRYKFICVRQEFLPWRTIDGEDFPCAGETQLEVLIQGIFDKRRLLELIKSLIIFEENTDLIRKKFLRYPFCTTPTNLN